MRKTPFPKMVFTVFIGLGAIGVALALVVLGVLYFTLPHRSSYGPWLSGSLSVNKTSGVPPLSVTFTLRTKAENIGVDSWQLDVNGDGNPDYSGKGVPPSKLIYTYTRPGDYKVTLQVWDSLGGSFMDFKTINVSS